VLRRQPVDAPPAFSTARPSLGFKARPEHDI